jgi:hypothetical protein
VARLVVETPAAKLPVDICVMRNHLRVPTEKDDDLIKVYMAAATRQVENFLGRTLINTSFRQSLDNFPYYVDAASSPQAFPPVLYSQPRYSSNQWNYSQEIKLLRAPLVNVSRISYVGTDNAEHDLFPDLDYDSWSAGTKFAVGDQILDPNGNVQEVTSTGDDATTGTIEPTWASSSGDTVNDNHVIWTCRGPRSSSDFVQDRDNAPPRLFPKPGGVWPAALYIPNAVRIHFTAGYGTEYDDVPQDYRLAVMILTTGYYEFREPVSALGLKEIPWGVKNLLWNDRVVDFAPTRG